MSVPRHLSLVLAAVATMAVACLGPLAPRSVESSWALETIDGEALPRTFAALGREWTVFADTIRFFDNDEWERRSVLQWRSADGELHPRDDTSSGFVTRRDGLIVLDFECRDEASCVAPDRVELDGDQLRQSRTFHHPGTELVYRRF